MAELRYHAGVDEDLRLFMEVNPTEVGLDIQRSSMLIRFIEFWCQKNARGSWRVDQTVREMRIWFADERDMVLFRISEEGAYFDGPLTFCSWH